LIGWSWRFKDLKGKHNTLTYTIQPTIIRTELLYNSNARLYEFVEALFGDDNSVKIKMGCDFVDIVIKETRNIASPLLSRFVLVATKGE